MVWVMVMLLRAVVLLVVRGAHVEGRGFEALCGGL